MNRRSLLSALLVLPLVLAPLLGSGCLSPTLPLPPPAEPEQMEPAATDGVWILHGSCTSGAMVLVRNERTGDIFGVEDDEHTGRYELELAAERCDRATIFEALGDDITEGTSFVIRLTVAGVPQEDCSSP